MKINFKCIELSIQEEEFGCTVTFSDSRSSDDQFKTVEEIMNSVEKYLLIQRTYAEDEYDTENYHIESSESEAYFEPGEKILMNFYQNRLEVKWPEEKILIELNLKNQEIENLLQVLKIQFKERITITRE